MGMNIVIKSPMPALGAVAGLTAGPLFRRYEPSISQFILTVIGVILTTIFLSVKFPEGSSGSYIYDAGASVALYLIFLSFSILHYRILSRKHPLHDIPGPFLARCSKAYTFSRLIRGKIRDDLLEWHRQYGDVVRIAPNQVSVIKSEAVKQIHGARSWIRSDNTDASVHSKIGAPKKDLSLMSLREHHEHSPRRKIWDRAFTIGALRDYEPMVLRRISQLCEQLDKREGKVIDLNEWLGYLVFDITSDLAYGGGTSFVNEASDPNGIVHGVVLSLRLQGRTMFMPWLAPVIHMMSLGKKSGAFLTYCRKRFLVRSKEGSLSEGRDFMHHMISAAADAGAEISEVGLASEASLVMAAGADTTRIAISVIFMFMIRQPELYKKLQSTIDEALNDPEVAKQTIGTDDYPLHDAVKKIPLLDAYIDEALRIHPPLSVEPVRLAPEGGAKFGDHFIAPGVPVCVPANVIHRDPRYFEAPMEYKPERWLKKETIENDTLTNKAAFFPFCAGKQFAYQEMRMLVSTLVWKYEIAFRPGFDDYAFENSIVENGTLLEITRPLEVLVTRRSSRK